MINVSDVKTNPALERRFCLIRISKAFIEHNYQEAKEVLSNFLIFRAEFRYDFGDTIEYMIFHEKLPVVENYVFAPIMNVILTKEENKIMKIELVSEDCQTKIEI